VYCCVNKDGQQGPKGLQLVAQELEAVMQVSAAFECICTQFLVVWCVELGYAMVEVMLGLV
jgi:hypothetical protein